MTKTARGEWNVWYPGRRRMAGKKSTFLMKGVEIGVVKPPDAPKRSVQRARRMPLRQNEAVEIGKKIVKHDEHGDEPGGQHL